MVAALAQRLEAAPGAVVVMKFGGTSVADPERIRSVARRLVEAKRAGARVVGVVSAMGQTTDKLVALAHRVSPRPKPRELDMLVSVGERISCALVEMAIADLGEDGISLTGSQAGIVTDTVHGKAKIVDVRARRVHEALDAGKIVLVAGEMLELAASGARVLQLRSVEFARNHGVRLHVRSTFSGSEGTWVREEDERMLEKATISGVTHTLEEALYEVDDARPADLFEALADASVSVDTIMQIGPHIVFSGPLDDRVATAGALDRLGATWSERDRLGKVSVVGTGMKSHPSIVARTFATLRDLQVEPQFVSTSPVKIAFYVPEAEAERVVKALHDAFGLSVEAAHA